MLKTEHHGLTCGTAEEGRTKLLHSDEFDITTVSTSHTLGTSFCNTQFDTKMTIQSCQPIGRPVFGLSEFLSLSHLYVVIFFLLERTTICDVQLEQNFISHAREGRILPETRYQSPGTLIQRIRLKKDALGKGAVEPFRLRPSSKILPLKPCNILFTFFPSFSTMLPTTPNNYDGESHVF